VDRPLARIPALLLVLTMASIGALSLKGASEAAASGHLVAEGLSPAQKKARTKALDRCRTIRVAKKRKSCVRRVNRKYRKLAATPIPEPPPVGPTEQVLVRDKYFSPDSVEIPRGGSILWDWGDSNKYPHNVSLWTGPKGVSLYDFVSPLAPAINYTFKRSFAVAGQYQFACPLHHLMTMTVEVKG
jgi:plastocyanin